ncbi:MAG: LLM class F420-dependent oxidoreductase [Acidimicrobiales bacterium]|nr:LLM class F420-dependent oxidoreductase [Acidimicrobiales bacterium]
MKVGVFAVNMEPWLDPTLAGDAAGWCEELGYDSLWVGEHMVLPSPRVAPSPMEPTDPMLDPLVSLAWFAARTERMLLGTGILLLPQRHPVQLAKELASLDVLSGGRLVVGVGIGYLEPELRAVGVPPERRDQRALEHLAALRALWTMEAPAFHGEFVDFGGVDAHPRPVQPGGPPVVMGGRAPAAFRRAVLHADGWYGFLLDPPGAAAAVTAIHRAGERLGRPVDPDAFEISVTPSVRLTPGVVDAYRAAGVHRLIVYRPGLGPDGLRAHLEASSPAALGC